MESARWGRGARLGAVALAAWIAFGPAVARAEADSDTQELRQRLEALEQETATLKRKLEVKEEAETAKAKDTPVIGAGRDGFYLKSADGKNVLRIRGYTQADFRAFGEGSRTNPSTFAFRRVRPIFEGTVSEYVDFKIMPDFAGNSITLFDAYANIRYFEQAQLLVGKFKPPVGLERLQSATALMFMERSFPTLLVPSRDLGIQLHGQFGEGLIAYQVGVFNGAIDNSANFNGDLAAVNAKEVAARIFTHPFKNADWEFARGFGVGLAATYQDPNTSLESLRFRTAGQQTFFRYNPATVTGLPGAVNVEGAQYRVSPQAYFYYGPFGLMTEYVLENERLVRGGASTFATNEAWQASFSYVLTGENASYRGVVPRSPVALGGDGWGAWELAARAHQIKFDSDIFPLYANPTTSAKGAIAFTVGLNWYMNPNIKVVFNYERTAFNGGAPGNGNFETENAFLTRLQLAF